MNKTFATSAPPMFTGHFFLNVLASLFPKPIDPDNHIQNTFPCLVDSMPGNHVGRTSSNHGEHRIPSKDHKQLAPYLQRATWCLHSSPGIYLSMLRVSYPDIDVQDSKGNNRLLHSSQIIVAPLMQRHRCAF